MKKSKLTYSTLLVALAACLAGLQLNAAEKSGKAVEKTGQAMENMGQSMENKGQAMQSRAEESKGDAEVLALLTAINENEIKAAKVASKKKTDAKIMAFAAKMEQQHKMNLDKTKEIGKKINVSAEETDAVEAIEKKGETELSALKPLEGPSFSSAYITAMVKDHTEALDMIDQKLMKDASNSALKQHLTETRKHVSMHLEEAKKIQAGLGS